MGIHPSEVVEKGLLETGLRRDGEHAVLVARLQRAHVGAGDLDRRRDDVVLDGTNAAGQRQPRRHLVQARHAAQVAGRLLARRTQVPFDLLQPRDVDQRDHDAPGDSGIVRAAIRNQTQQVLAAVDGGRFAFERGHAVENRLAIVFEINRLQVRRDLPDRPADVGLGHVEWSRRGCREALDAQLGIEKDGGDVCAFDQIRQVVAVAQQVMHPVGQLPIQRANFVVGGAELPDGRVGRLAFHGRVIVAAIDKAPAGTQRSCRGVSQRSDRGRGAVAAGGH